MIPSPNCEIIRCPHCYHLYERRIADWEHRCPNCVRRASHDEAQRQSASLVPVPTPTAPTSFAWPAADPLPPEVEGFRSGGGGDYAGGGASGSYEVASDSSSSPSSSSSDSSSSSSSSDSSSSSSSSD